MKLNLVKTLIVIVLVVIAPLLLGISGITPWSKIACRFDYIDINSGKIKTEHWYYYIKCNESITDTIMSETIPPLRSSPDWKTVNCLSPGFNHSPHFRFHGAIQQLYEIRMIKDLYELDGQATVDILNKVRITWIGENSYHGVDKILKEYQTTLQDSFDRKLAN